MTQDALLIKETLESMIEKEIANKVEVKEDGIYIFLPDGSKAKITLKNVAQSDYIQKIKLLKDT